MPSFENRPVPEGINYSQEHPLKEFSALLMGVGLSVILVVFVVVYGAGFIARFIPFSYEQALAKRYSDMLLQQFHISDNAPEKTAYLQTLTDQIAKAELLPEDMQITLHYSEADVVNAFATLGGNIIIYKGLINKLPSENALAMVIAHEIAHVKHRDPVVALGRGFTLAFAMLAISGVSDGAMLDKVLGGLSGLTALSFNRDQEHDADTAALQALYHYYGHVGGAESLFEVFQQQAGEDLQIEFLSTHPLTHERIEQVREFAEQHHGAGNSGEDLRLIPNIF